MASIATAIKNEKKFVIYTPNPEIITLSLQSPLFQQLLNNSDINIPDGVGLKIACNLKYVFSFFHSKFLNLNSKLKIIHGIDFMLDLCSEAEKNDWTIGLLGGKNNTAIGAKTTLLKLFPQLKISYTCGDFEYKIPPRYDFRENGKINSLPLKTNNIQINDHDLPHNQINNDMSQNAILTRVDSANLNSDNNNWIKPPIHIDLLFVALGTPKEQIWIDQNKKNFPATVFMEVGGSFDILSGRLHRAPKIIQKIGLEWLFRLIQEPHRVKRQMRLVKFIWLVLTRKNSIED